MDTTVRNSLIITALIAVGLSINHSRELHESDLKKPEKLTSATINVNHEAIQSPKSIDPKSYVQNLRKVDFSTVRAEVFSLNAQQLESRRIGIAEAIKENSMIEKFNAGKLDAAQISDFRRLTLEASLIEIRLAEISSS